MGSGFACPSTDSLINMLWGGLMVDGVSEMTLMRQ